MSWNDFYARRDIMRDAIDRAVTDDGRLPFTELDGAVELFGTERQLLLALYHRWTLLLSGKLRAMAAAPEDGHAPEVDTDLADRVGAAWRETAAEHATLRAVLDTAIETDPEALRPALEAEQRMLAFAAGLADPGESIADATQVGASFLALIRHAGAVPARGRIRGTRRGLFSVAS
ncbi:hypothetical protein [Haloechinothrix halophila]|uniref:hypothetical protein n=1 Tax=Haloechinothrix halophila TaxID=1069073 RepID=UPI000404CA54|nr:hypothetical protein [Haloechinothrix halophila]